MSKETATSTFRESFVEANPRMGKFFFKNTARRLQEEKNPIAPPATESVSSPEDLKPIRHTVVITGASKGIGRAILEGYEEKNKKLYVDQKSGKIYKKYDYTILAPSHDELDLSKPASIKTYIKKHKDDGIDIIINNAGINPTTDFEKMTEEERNEVMQVNLHGPAALIKGFIPYMKEQGWGRIVNIGSIWGEQGRGPRVVYSESKHALEGLTKSLAQQYGPYDILVNQVNPGVIDTKMTQRNLPEGSEARKKILEQVPLGKLGDPKAIARIVRHLASPKNTFTTGMTYRADGGYLAI